MVTSLDLLKIFYVQHLGPAFLIFRCWKIDRPVWNKMLVANAVLPEILECSPELMRDVLLIFSRHGQESVKLVLNLENESAGEGLIDFLGNHCSDKTTDAFRSELQILAERVQALHYTWRRDEDKAPPFGLHRILIPGSVLAQMDKVKTFLDDQASESVTPGCRRANPLMIKRWHRIITWKNFVNRYNAPPLL